MNIVAEVLDAIRESGRVSYRLVRPALTARRLPT
jgi:hypothetical protein